MNIAALQETRLAGDGSLREQNYTFFWQGKRADEQRIHGVGFAVKNSLLSTIELPTGGTERLLILKMTARTGVVNFVCAYAPTLCSTEDEKDQFYDALDSIVRCVPSKEALFIMGDFNARVGADCEAWPSVIGHHGVGKMNENGQRLLELCSFHKLAVTNTFFQHKDRHKVSWRHPRSKHWHQLDMTLTKRRDLNNVQNTRSMHSADCDTDHILIRSKIQLVPRKMHHSKTESLPRINASRVSCPITTQRLRETLKTSLEKGRGDVTTASAKWKQVRTALYQSGLEHYFELYSTENVVADAVLDAICQLPVMQELDEKPTEEELRKAIDCLSTGKAPGEDGIPGEVIKAGKEELIEDLHELLCLCWKEGSVPQDMRDAKIVTLYKNKGDRSDCNSYRGISLLSIVGKVFARVILARLKVLAARVYHESQCGFRAGRSTIDMIFSVRQLQEKCQEQNEPLFLAFIDLTKAFDLVSRSGLFQLLKKIGCPPKLHSIIQSFHTDMRSTVSYNGARSEPFPISSGVKQGCVLAPTLFGIFFSMLLTHAFSGNEDGVYLHTRSNGRLFNLARLRTKTKVRHVTIREALFADDAALVTHSEEALQRLIDRFAHACVEFGLTISIKKTEVMGQGTDSPPSIHIGSHKLNAVDRFQYLGSTISSNLSLEPEINSRIAKASAVMSKLHKRVWSNNNLTVNTKMRVYRACVLSTLLYSSETWTTYAAQEKRLNSFHLRCLRRILSIRWQDKIPNTVVLERAGLPSIFMLLSQRRLRWLGHVRRMADGRIPKDLLYGELSRGARSRGRPRLRFKDTCKRDLKSASIDIQSWESLAESWDSWRAAVHCGTKQAKQDRTDHLKEKRAARKRSCSIDQAATFHTCRLCGKDCHSRIGLHSHTRRCSDQN